MSKAEFAGLHQAGAPLVLYNIWDAGSALAVAKAGAKALATGSASLASAQGFEDGEDMPFATLAQTVSQIARATRLPLSVDFEAGFADDLATLSGNATALLDAGVVGCNLEDRLITADGLRDMAEQAERIAALDSAGLFVNARTDVFLDAMAAGDDPDTQELLDAALARGAAYAAAGAGSFFMPGLSDPELIAKACAAMAIPVNIMRLPGMVSNADLADLGVRRISYGPAPWRDAMASVEEAARNAMAG
ncbi:MAG: isocitrate lyase/phosphoenolpyruvate mutase family protein [Erythrobacter sp.]